jgi:hypothetical protein
MWQKLMIIFSNKNVVINFEVSVNKCFDIDFIGSNWLLNLNFINIIYIIEF